MTDKQKPKTKCDFCEEKNLGVISKGGGIASNGACYNCERKKSNDGLFSVKRTYGQAGEEDHKEIYEKLNNQDERIKKLEKDKEQPKKKEKPYPTDKALQKVIFGGAVASAIHALISLGNLITSWFKK